MAEDGGRRTEDTPVKYAPEKQEQKRFHRVNFALIEFKEGTPVDSIDLKEGIVLHMDSKEVPIELEILDASDIVSMEEFNIMIPTKKDRSLAVQA